MAGSNENQGCLGFLFGWLRRSEGQANGEQFPYRVRQDFLSRAEASFYRVLCQVVDDRLVIFTKVGLGEIFYVAQSEERFAWMNRIRQKHVDFLLCDPQTLQPVAGLELDDRSHERPDRQERDAFVDQVFETANLPLLHIPARHSYTLEEIRGSLRTVIAVQMTSPVNFPAAGPVQPESAASAVITIIPGPAPVESAPVEITPLQTPPKPPICSRCGVPMTLRRARRGEQYGSMFWGCPNYPRCRETQPAEHQP